MVVDGSSLFPLADLLQAMGTKYEWSPREETVSAERAGIRVVAAIEQSGGPSERRGCPAGGACDPSDEKTMVPLRFVCEALHYEEKWDALKRVIEVKLKKD